MAAVHGPTSIPVHPDPFRTQNHNIPRNRAQFNPVPPQKASAPVKQAQPSMPSQDPFYGHETTARLCARFITHLFACPEGPPVATTATHAKLPYFIAYALHRTKLHSSVTFASLVLLQRLKARFPTARGSSGHRLFISAFMIASKVICDDTYSNKSWSIVGQNLFALREINQMEREMCSYLEWELNVEPQCLRDFERMVRKDFSGPGPYPTYTLTSSLKSSTASNATSPSFAAPASSPVPVPTYGQRHPSPPKPAQPAPPGTGAASYATPPTTPDTPSPSYSTSTSPASSASPRTPIGYEDVCVKIASATSSPVWAIRHGTEQPVTMLKGKVFAYAAPAVW